MEKEIAYYMRRLYRQRLTTMSGGNISAKQNNSVFITPSGIDKGEITAEQVGELNMDGDIIKSIYKLSLETPVHLAIYNARADIKAIVHAHPPYGTAYASSNKPLNSELTSEGRLVLGEITLAQYELMGTQNLAEVVAQSAKKSNIILMQNHGVIALGNTLLEAFDRLEVLEFTAKMNFITDALNMKSKLTKEQIKEIDSMNR